jgi:hypothetical protein
MPSNLALEIGTGLNISTSSLKELIDRTNQVKTLKEQIGKKYFKISYLTFTHLTKDMLEREKVIDYYQSIWNPKSPRETFEHMLIGPPKFVEEKLMEISEETVIDYFITSCKATDSVEDPLDVLYKEIIKYH